MNVSYLNNIVETVGNTPLVKLNNMTRGIKATVLVKVEFFNPGGSVKDRIAVAIIEDAEKKGSLKPGGTIVEATSGNTGAGLAMVAALKGYKAIFTMPDKMSQEKVRHLRAFGAEVIVTPTAVPADSPESYYSVARKIVEETPNAILANQYFNPLNPEAHYRSTGPEIWQQTAGKIDYFVAGMGTGGTISGTGRYLKEQNPDVKVVGVDPIGSILKEYFYTKQMIEARPYKVEGVGEDIIPGTTHFEFIDEVVEVTDKESFNAARRLAREEGIFTGGSCGLAVAGALKVAAGLPEGKLVVVLLPDSGAKYLSTFYSDDWMRENRFLDPTTASLDRALAAKKGAISELIAAAPADSVRHALSLMKQNIISQLPVLDNGNSVGRLEEGEVMGKVIKDNALLDASVRDIMQESLPVITFDKNIEEARNFLSKEYPAVLVERHGKLAGIITKSDLLEFISA